MKSHDRRIQKLESKAGNTDKDAPANLNELYALADDPESDFHKELEAMYSPTEK